MFLNHVIIKRHLVSNHTVQILICSYLPRVVLAVYQGAAPFVARSTCRQNEQTTSHACGLSRLGADQLDARRECGKIAVEARLSLAWTCLVPHDDPPLKTKCQNFTSCLALKNMFRHWHFNSFPHTEMAEAIPIIPHVGQRLTYLYHGCRWPGNARVNSLRPSDAYMRQETYHLWFR